MTWITLTGVGAEVAGGTSAADPQLQFFENFPGHLGDPTFVGISNGTLSIHAVNIPLSISLNFPVILMRRSASISAGSLRNALQFGLYSLNGSTLSLANSAEAILNIASSTATAAFTSWISFATSKTQNITPGAWYFAINQFTQSTNYAIAFYGNSSLNPVNAIPGGFLLGRMTVSTNAIPDSIATSALDITGSDATRQPYIIITA